MSLLDLNEDIQDTCLKSLMINFIFDYYKYNGNAYVRALNDGVYLRRDDTFELECNVDEDELPEALIFLKSTSDHSHWKIVIDKKILQSGNLLNFKDDPLSIIHMKFVLDYMNKENQS